MNTIGGGCKFPLAAYASIDNNEIKLSAMIGNHITNKTIYLNEKSSIGKAEELGYKTALKIKSSAVSLGINLEI
jgi:hydroxymethylbilane synthase